MITIYHNPRCRKSREGLAVLEASENEFEVIHYLTHPLSESELKGLLKKLGIPVEQLIRKNESIWKEQFKNKILSDPELIKAMVTYPKLIERPIVVRDNRAVIGRPKEKILDLLSK